MDTLPQAAFTRARHLLRSLRPQIGQEYTGRLISAVYDKWEDGAAPLHLIMSTENRHSRQGAAWTVGCPAALKRSATASNQFASNIPSTSVFSLTLFCNLERGLNTCSV